MRGSKISLLPGGRHSLLLLNDLLDLASDRKHPRKRKRPFASGDIPILYGIAMFPALIIAGFGIAFIFLPIEFVVSLTIYYIITTLYSFKLKKLQTRSACHPESAFARGFGATGESRDLAKASRL